MKRLLALALITLACESALAQGRTDIVSLAAGPGDSAYAVGWPGENGTMAIYATADGGATWRRSGEVPRGANGPMTAIGTPGGAVIAWSPVVCFMSRCYNTRMRSDDGGRTWDHLRFPSDEQYPVSDPAELVPASLFASSITGGYVIGTHGDRVGTPYHSVMRSEDDGVTWEATAEVFWLPYYPSSVSARANRAVVLAPLSADCGRDLLCTVASRSSDGGRTWTHATTTGAFDDAESFYDIVLRSTLAPDGTLYAWDRTDGPPASLYRLPPSDSVWVATPMPVGAAVVNALDVADGGTLHLGTEVGAFVSADGGATWAADGLSGLAVVDLGRTETGTLLALTDGAVRRRSGAGDWTLSGLGVSAEPTGPAARDFAVGSSPNPFSARLGVAIAGATPGPASVGVFDALGRELSAGTVTVPTSGAAVWEWDGAAVPAGLYLVVVTDASGRRAARRVTKR